MTEIGRMLLEEGIEKGKMELLVTQLTSKFRHITEEDVKAIKNLPSHKLNIISVKIFDIASLEELRTYFD